MSCRPSSQRPPPISRTMMVATTAGKKMPATHCVKPAPSPAVDDPSLASWTLPVTTAATKNARAGAGKSR
jgi:hypothetical protein